MSDHSYETGSLNLPFVSVLTFAKYELGSNWSQINAIPSNSSRTLRLWHAMASQSSVWINGHS